MTVADLDGRCLQVNRAMCELTRYPERDLLSMQLVELTHCADRDAEHERQRGLLTGEVNEYRIEQRTVTSQGSVIWCQKSVGLVRDSSGAPCGLVVQLEDISARRIAEERLRELADHDSLTGLRNRRVFDQDLSVQISRCKRYGEQAALLMIDLDDFKQINDRHGHAAGDEMLRIVARALVKRLRGSDLVARIGGDEFAVLLAHVRPAQSNSVREDLRRIIGDCTVVVVGATLRTGASVGIAHLNDLMPSAEAALLAADRSMYAAKRAGHPGSSRLAAVA
jgi:diguanylate cyclase (GGDEF)-like protein/PAS domain S-box-containing protein